MPWEHRRAWRASFWGHRLIEIGTDWVPRQKMTETKEWPFLFMLARFDDFCFMGYQKRDQGYPRKESRRFGYQETCGALPKPLSIHAKPALISGMDFHQKWTKTKGSHDQIQIQMRKYKYKHTNANTNTHTQIQIQIRGGGSEVKFRPLAKIKSSHENGHISGTVRPTSPQHHSNRSSWRARPEKHPRGSLTCPGNTWEPEAPVLGVTDS